MLILHLILMGVTAMAVHEGAHWIAAASFHKRIKFIFTWGSLYGFPCIPRLTWNMPGGLTKRQAAIVAAAGFAVEVGTAIAAGWTNGYWGMIYMTVVLVHIALYPLYCGEANDYSWII